MDTHNKIREHISALSDGALCSTDLELAMAAMQTADGRQAWHLYHRIGDVLRATPAPELSEDFADRLAARLASEPVPARRQPKQTVADGRPAASVHLSPAGQGTAAAPAQSPTTMQSMACEASTDAVAVSQVKPAIISVS